MSLLKAELRRLAKRRLTRWMLALVVVLMATVALAMGANNQKPGPDARAEAEAQAAAEYEAQQRWIEEDFERCEEAQAAGGAQAQDWPEDCAQILSWQTPQEQMVEWFMPPTFEFRTDFPPMILVWAGLLGLFAFVVGASFVGAEWRAGGMMNLLLWRPRRLRVLGAKLAALLASLLGLGVLLGAAWVGMFWLVAEFRGVTDSMTAGTWQSFGLTGIRGLALALAAGTIGFALASLGRHTATAMGSAIAAFVVGIAGVALIAGEMLRLRFSERWLWTTYITAWMDKKVELTDWEAPCEPTTGFDECVQPTMEITWQMAGIGMAAVLAVLAVLVAVAMWQMRQRDIT